MNIEYYNNGDNVLVTNEKGCLSLKENNENINEILHSENKIELLEAEIKSSKLLSKRNQEFKDVFIAVAIFLPVLGMGLLGYEIFTAGLAAVVSTALIGVPLILLATGIFIGSAKFSGKVVKENDMLLNDLYKSLEIEKIKNKNLKEYKNKETTVETKKAKKSTKMDLEKLKREMAYIIAKSYYLQNKEKFITYYNSGTLHRKLPLKSADDQYVYEALTNIIANDLENTKKLIKTK